MSTRSESYERLLNDYYEGPWNRVSGGCGFCGDKNSVVIALAIMIIIMVVVLHKYDKLNENKKILSWIIAGYAGVVGYWWFRHQ